MPGFFVALLAVVLLAVPRLVEHRPWRERLLAYAGRLLPAQVSMAAAGWRWLPLPALTVSGLRVETGALVLTVPQAEAIIDPGFLFSGRLSVFRARLTDPELTINSYRRLGAWPLTSLPVWARVELTGGRLSLPGPAGQAGGFVFTGLNGRLSYRRSLLSFAGQAAASPFATRLGLTARVDLRRGDYQAEVAGQGLDSGRLLPPGPDSLLPVLRGVDFTVRIEGQGWGRYRVRLDSGPGELWVRGRRMRLSGIDGLSVSRSSAALAVEIGGLRLADPALRLHGRVVREAGDKPGAAPVWSLDLAGEDIDLGRVREEVLALFGDQPVAREVCAIVRGGEAATARYVFKGQASDFAHLERMKIWADARRVPVFIPEVGLSLDRASGPISILDGRLTGKGLSADIDQSHGQDGELLLDLADDRHGFLLDMNLDADLGDLRDVLVQVVPSPRFQDELYHFVKVKGRAQGHLRIGDDLRDLQTEVEVEAAQGQGDYDRLPWPFTLRAGRLTIGPGRVAWEGLRGSLGDQKVGDGQGQVTWGQGPARVTIDRLDADLDLAPLFAQGVLHADNRDLALASLAQGRLSGLSGQARLRDLHLSGPVSSPDEWRYQAGIVGRDLEVVGPGLPELHSPEVRIKLSQGQADFKGAFYLFDQELDLAGHYRHRLLDDWRGELKVDGEIGEGLGEWLKEKQLLPEVFFPRLPCRLANFILATPGPEAGPTTVRGELLALPEASDASLAVKLSREPGRVEYQLTFRGQGQEGALTYRAWPGPEGHSFLSWKGALDAATVNALFSQRLVTGGRVRGEASREVRGGVVVNAGQLELSDLTLGEASPLPGLALKDLSLRGAGQALVIERADFALDGAPASLSGKVADESGLRHLDLRLHLSRLDWEAVRRLLDDYRQRTGQGHSPLDTARGRIDFEVERMDYAEKGGAGPPDEKTTGSVITLSGMRGGVVMAGKGIDVQLQRADVCGIDLRGGWHVDRARDERNFTFTTGDQPLFFEKALPCLGFKQSLIVGPFSLHGEISGRPKHWQRGEVSLSSSEGVIRRMALLSKIFTAVNFTDLFTSWGGPPGLDENGLPYNHLDLAARINDNRLTLDRAVIKGKGVNVSGRGTIELADLNSDLTFFIAPFKMVDSLVTNIPLLGKAIGGRKASVLSFPVAVTGNIKNPEVTALAPGAVGDAALELLRDTLTLPLHILSPEEPPGK